MAEPTQPDLQALDVPEGVSRAAFRGVLIAYSEEFHHRGMIPTLEQVYRTWSKVPQKTMAAIIASPEFEVGCQLLGVPTDPNGGLSQEQLIALSVLADPTDRRTVQGKMRALGVPMGRYVNWRKQPLFRERYEAMTSGAYYDYLPEIRQALIEKAVSGNLDAIKLVYAKTGEYDPAAQSVEDARLIVLKVAELVMKNVRAPEEREAIMVGLRDFGLEQQAARAQGQRPLTIGA